MHAIKVNEIFLFGTVTEFHPEAARLVACVGMQPELCLQHMPSV